MKTDHRLKKIQRLLAIAGDNPQTEEQWTSYRIARKLLDQIDNEKPAFGGYLGTGGQTEKERGKWIKTAADKVKDLLHVKRSIPWNQFFKIEESEYKIYLIEPGPSVRNNQSYLLAKTIESFYRPDKELFDLFRNKTILTVKSPYRCNFRIIMRSKEIGFYLIIPTEKVYEVLRRAEGIYDTNITIKEVEKLPSIEPSKAFCTELHYKNHSMFSLKTDKDNNYPLPSLLSVVRTLEDDDIAIFDAMMEPYSTESWMKECIKAYNLLDKGYMPHTGLGGTLLSSVHEAITKARYEIADLGAITREQKLKLKQQMREEVKARGAFRIKEGLTNPSKRKAGDEVLKTWLRIAVQSNDIHRAKTAAYSIANSFKDISSTDNELIRRDIPPKWNTKYIEAIKKSQPLPIIAIPNKMSIDEVGKLTQLPGDSLIKEFPEIISQNLKEVRLPDELTQDDIKHVRLGTVTERGKTYSACFPLESYGDVSLKSVYDALCTASFGQGKQGTGKSDGYGSVWAYDMIINGFTAIIMDTADGQVLRNLINALPEDYPDNKIHALNLDDKAYPIALNWSDVYGRTFGTEGDEELQALEISERITSRFVSFINSLSNTGEFTDRMAQYVISCMRAITNLASWSFLDLELALTSPSYREELLKIPGVQDQPDVVRDLETLQEKASREKDTSLIEPILSRLKVLAGTQFMANLFYQDPKLNDDGKPILDLRKIMDNPEGGYGHIVAIQASGDAWEDNQATILGFMLDKINFNAFSRIDQDQCDRKPCLVWIDEPHKVIKSMEGRLAGTSVEFRKYRVKNLFTGHSIDQMGAAANSLLDGGAQITSYKTERLSELSRFAHNFAPYSDAKQLYESLPQKWRAINSVRLPSGKDCPAFIADMLLPSKFVKDRTQAWHNSAKKYGRPWKDVKNTIQEKRKKYAEMDVKWLLKVKEVNATEKGQSRPKRNKKAVS